jgi:uncharacterized membrane protein YkvA (DUF1232 family)
MNNKFVAGVVALLSVFYLLNIGAGFIDLIPDFVPGFGNIDEGVAGAALLWAISVLRGKRVETMKKAQVDEHPDRS